MSLQTFSTGYCDCCAPLNLCLEVMFCGPCQLSRQSAALAGDKDTCTVPGCLYAMCCMPCASYQVRTGVIGRYQLDESLTCCRACCFPACSTCQVHRELTIRGNWPGGQCCISKPFEMK
jgi:Cys-rich protein (TIGR01571 family)